MVLSMISESNESVIKMSAIGMFNVNEINPYKYDISLLKGGTETYFSKSSNFKFDSLKTRETAYRKLFPRNNRYKIKNKISGEGTVKIYNKK